MRKSIEGVLTLSNDTRYGPWAEKLLTADELNQVIYSVDTSGVVSNYFLGINADQFRLIQTNQDLYCVAFDSANSEIVKLSRNLFTNYVGDVLVEQAGENGAIPELFIVHWNSGTTNFESHGIPLRDFLNNNDYFEKSTFAPVNMPPVQ